MSGGEPRGDRWKVEEETTTGEVEEAIIREVEEETTGEVEEAIIREEEAITREEGATTGEEEEATTGEVEEAITREVEETTGEEEEATTGEVEGATTGEVEGIAGEEVEITGEEGAVIGEGHQILKGLLPQAVEEEQESILAALREDEIERQGSILVDYVELISDQMVIRELPDLTKELKEQPEMILNCLGVAIHQVLTTDLERQAAELQGDELPVTTPLINIPHISARLYNYDPVTPLRLLRASVFGRLVCVRGTVVRVSNIRPLCARLAFRCLGCSYTQALTLQHGQFTTPTKCALQNCRSRTLVPCRSSPLTQTVDWQIIKVQELMGGEQREAGRIPRTVECHLTSDLCDSCVPGDTVTVTGIVRVTKEGLHRGNKDQCMFLLYIEARLQSKVGGQGSAEAHSAEEFSLKELYAIQEIQSQPDLLRLMVQQTKNTNKNSVPVRGDPHVLMVGDPGLGKSQMLQGIYVCGNSTSSTGLTVTLSRDAATGDYALEAGALVLADQVGNQQQALLEAMEQQSVSLAKAGIVSSLPARTSVVAAANPIGGHYNRGKTVSENLKMGSALLSRFDVGQLFTLNKQNTMMSD
ncbi:hypothetical protein WMY93_018572 [Mugilogobius chulae]|uniref:DNA helicase MCM8 n=1 Tax=Mugilogobius chulae TaxID=88201 RepID=A0AAW0NKD1_9GOBI